MNKKIFWVLFLSLLFFLGNTQIPARAENTTLTAENEAVDVKIDTAEETAPSPENNEISEIIEETENSERTLEGDSTMVDEAPGEGLGSEGSDEIDTLNAEEIVEPNPGLETSELGSEETVEEDTPFSLEASITLKNGCEITDTAGVTHLFPGDESSSEYLAVCALAAAQEAGYIKSYELADSSFGLYLQSIHDIFPSSTEYWALWKNDEFADCGIECLALSSGDTLTLVLTDWATETESDKIEIYIAALEESADNTHLSLEENIVVKNGCEVTDSAGKIHFFPKEISKEYVAICAFSEALAQGFVDEIVFADFGFGLFIESVNGITASNAYWKLEHNGVSSNVGAAELELAAGDKVSLVLTQFDPVTFEETSLEDHLTLTVESLEEAFNNIILPDRCSVVDMGGITHEFPENMSPAKYLGICALSEALAQGHTEDIDFSNFGFGLFVDNFNNTLKPENSYWQFRVNEISASVGVTEAEIQEGDVVSFVLTTFNPETFEESPVEPPQSISLRIVGLESVSQDDGGSSGGGNAGNGNQNEGGSLTLSTDNAITYLKGVQESNGSFVNSELYSDWAAIAYAAADVSGNAKSSLLNYMRDTNKVSSLITDNERRAMALLALSENPYDFEGINYIAAIIEEFDGSQFGDGDLVNDDIFALIPLASAGFDESDETILKTIEFILSEQKANGSWENSVDITAAAVQALSPFDSARGVSNALEQAESYIMNKQESDGGWGNVFSTSWALQAESALGASWAKDGKNGLDYLGKIQADAKNDGALLPETESRENIVWATSYTIPAGLGLAWNDILESVSKPKEGGGKKIVNSSSSSRAEENDEKIATNDNEKQELASIQETVLASTEETYILDSSLSPSLPVTRSENSNQADVNQGDLENKNKIAASVDPSNLTATVLGATDSFTSKTQKFPIALGTVSGFLLIFLILKNIFAAKIF